MGFLKRLACKHEWRFVRNIYGDEINMAGGRRSWWRCPKCGACQCRDELYKGPEATEFSRRVNDLQRRMS